MRGMRGDQAIPLGDLLEVAAFETFDAKMVQVAVVVAKEPHYLALTHVKRHHQTFQNELG